MGNGGYLFEILILGVVAAFLIHRLWTVLGRRHGEEQQRTNPFAGGAGQDGDDKVVRMPNRGGSSEASERAAPAGPVDSRQVGLSSAFAQIKIADPSFDENTFVDGAKAAFRMIVEAYAAGDRETLGGLLAPELYETFEKEISRREDAGESLETEIKQIHNADITEAQLNGTAVHVTIRLVSDQVRRAYDSAGNLIEDESDQGPTELVDVWTFSRVAGSPDPNWELVDTQTEG